MDKTDLVGNRRSTCFKYHRPLIYNILIVLAMAITLTIFVHKAVLNRFYNLEGERLVNIADLLSKQIDMDKLVSFVEEGDTQSHYFFTIQELLLKVQEDISNIDLIYIIGPTEDPSIWKVVLTTNTKTDHCLINGVHVHDQADGVYRIYSESLKNPGFVVNEASYISVNMPIPNEDGEISGILLIDIDMNSSMLWLRELTKYIVVIFVILSLLVIVYIINRKRKKQKITQEFLQALENYKINDKELLFAKKLPEDLDLIGKQLNRLVRRNYDSQQARIKQLRKAIKEKDKIFDVYRDVIYSTTQKKILLVNRKEFSKKISDDYPVYSKKIVKMKDIPDTRHETNNYLKKYSPDLEDSKRNKILLCLSEAVTNVIKHAGEGELLLSIDKKKITLYILDNGPGISLDKLANMVFLKGYSTKVTSLGSGFSILYYYMDRIFLCTTNHGTYLALESKLSKENKISSVTIESMGEAN